MSELSYRWEIEKNVKCVVCPDCAFTFDAFHTDNPAGYSCPACAEIRLTEALKQYADHRNWAIRPSDDMHRYASAVWIGPGALDVPYPDAPEIARTALVKDA